MPPQDLGCEDYVSATITIDRNLIHVHFGPGSDRAKFSRANDLRWIWHGRPNGDQPHGVKVLTEMEAQ
eukprot:4257583-Pyramimonas_sp.AAC.1